MRALGKQAGRQQRLQPPLSPAPTSLQHGDGGLTAVEAHADRFVLLKRHQAQQPLAGGQHVLRRPRRCLPLLPWLLLLLLLLLLL